MEAAETYFKLQSQNMPGRTKEYHVNPQNCPRPGQDFKQAPPKYNYTPLTLNKTFHRDDIFNFNTNFTF